MKEKKRNKFFIVFLSLVMMASTIVNAFPVHAKDDTAKLSITYHLESENGNMIAEPYYADIPIGSEYDVKSPDIDNYVLKDKQQENIQGTLNKNTNIKVVYTYDEKNEASYKINYIGVNSLGQEINLDTIEGTAPANTFVSIPFKEYKGYIKRNEDMKLLVTEDGQAEKNVYYDKSDKPAIIFVTEGSYVEPIVAEPGTDISDQVKNIQTPNRKGYVFDEWDKEIPTIMPDGDFIVNAKWIAGKSNYTVLYWFENADDDNYTLGSNSIVRETATGSTVEASEEDISNGDRNESETSNQFYGFDYSHCDPVEVKADGTSVLNIYYKREIWKINYMDKPEGGQTWKTIEGKYLSKIGDKLIDDATLKEHYGPDFAYMAKNPNQSDAAMLERFENSETNSSGYGQQNIYPYYNKNIYKYQIRQFSNNPNSESGEILLIKTSYIYYYKGVAAGMRLVPPEGFRWDGGHWKTAPTEEKINSMDYNKFNPKGEGSEGTATFRGNIYQYMDIYMNRKTSTLKYVSNGETIYQISNVPYEKDIDLSITPTNGEKHMKFAGWYYNPILMNSEKPLEKYTMPANDLVLYAKWVPEEIMVNFDTQGGSTVASQSVPYNSKATMPENPTKSGYTFAGWYMSPDGEERWSFDRLVDNDMTLYARWKPISRTKYTVRHVMQGEENAFYEETLDGGFGDTVTAFPLNPNHEKYPNNIYLKTEDDSTSKSLLLKENADKNVITFTYIDVAKKDYIVKYLNKVTNEEIVESKKVTTLNTIVTEDAIDISNYFLDNNSRIVQNVKENSEIIFYYIPSNLKVSYNFVDKDGLELPNEVKFLTPTDSNKYVYGSTVPVLKPTKTIVEVEDGRWVFKGYTGYENDTFIIQDNTLITGVWEFQPSYTLTYIFESITDGKTLPDEINALRPEDKGQYYIGDTAYAVIPDKESLKTEDGLWVFKGYKGGNSLRVENENPVFIGQWEFCIDKFDISYNFVVDGTDKLLPQNVQDLKPENEKDTIGYGEIAKPSVESFNDIIDEENDGYWKFKGWTPEKIENVSSDVEFVGTWEFVPNKHKVQYKFVSGTEGKELPKEFDRYLPKDTNEYVKGDKVIAQSLNVDYISVEDGVWVFSHEEGTGWDVSEKTVGNENLTFTGTWKFIEHEYYVNFEFVSDTGQQLPKVISDMLPKEYAVKKGISVTASPSTFTNVDVRDAGSWVFIGWDKTTVENVHDNVTFTGTWKYYDKQTVTGQNLVVYEGGLGSGNSQVTGDALPEPQWSSQIGDYRITVDGKPWDISKQGLPFSWEYRDSDGKKVDSSARAGVYGLYAYPMKGYEGKNVIINDKLLVLPSKGIKVSEVSVRDLTNNDDADTLSKEMFKNVYNYESPLDKNDNIFSRAIDFFTSLFKSDSALSGDFNENGTHNDDCDNTVPHAHVLEGTKFIKNGNENMPVNKGAKIGLLWDDLLENVLDSEERLENLHKKSVNVIEKEDKNLFIENKPIHTMFKYIDPVDMNDGNVWVSTVKNDLTIYVPYSELGENVDKNDRIAVTYYDGLTRDYTIDMNEDELDEDIKNSNAHFMTVEKIDTGILFDVPSKQFGPFEFLWQENYYSVDYDFVSSDNKLTLPEEVTSLTPKDSEIYKDGTEVKAIQPKLTKVKVEDGMWIFDGYDADVKTVTKGDVAFKGTWTFTKHTYEVKYQFESLTEGKELPREVSILTPESKTYEHEDMTTIVSPKQTTVKVSDGRWVFVGYDRKDTSIPVTDNMVITGYWRFDGNASILNNIPVIIASDMVFKVGDIFNEEIALKDVSAHDKEDGDVTTSLEIVEHDVDTTKAGTYHITYKATDSQGASTTKTIKVFIYPTLSDINNIPFIKAEDKELMVGDYFDPRNDVSATDIEDGDLTNVIEILANTVDTTKVGIYHVTYKVTDMDGASYMKTIKVVVKNQEVLPEVPIKPEKPQHPEQKPIEITDSNIPQTGDTVNISQWSIPLFLGFVGIAIFLYKRKIEK